MNEQELVWHEGKWKIVPKENFDIAVKEEE
jgi:hypothetical protein